MSSRNKRTKNELERMSVRDLQARFREVVGETTRNPNRRYLVRRIEEALAAQREEAAPRRSRRAASAEAQPTPEASEETTPRRGRRAAAPAEPAPAEAEPETPEAQEEDGAPAAEQAPRPRGRFSGMSVEELQAKYLEVVGRPTSSSNVAYMVWKIREAEKGRIPVGPRQSRRREGEPADMRILPLRMESRIVDTMDEAWRARGIKNRMEFFRQALGHYLTHLGADEAAALFAADE